VLTWYQLRKLAGGLRSSADSAAKGMMHPTTTADNKPTLALLLTRAHRAPFWIRSSALTPILTPVMVHLLSSLRLEYYWSVTLISRMGDLPARIVRVIQILDWSPTVNAVWFIPFSLGAIMHPLRSSGTLNVVRSAATIFPQSEVDGLCRGHHENGAHDPERCGPACSSSSTPA